MEGVDHREDLGCLIELVGTVADLSRADRTPRLVSAHTVNHEFGYGVEGEFARLGDEHVACAHEKVCGINRGEDVIVMEGVDALDRVRERAFGKGGRLGKVSEMPGGKSVEPIDLLDKFFPDGHVVADVDEDGSLVALHVRHEVLDDVGKKLALCTGAADRDEVADRTRAGHAGAAGGAVNGDIVDEFGVHVMTRVTDRAFGHRLKDVFAAHAAELFVTKIGGWGLHGVDGAFGKMQGHRPVVGNRVHDVGETGVDGGLSGPDMGTHIGDVLGQVPKHGCHELGVLLVARVV